MQHFTRDCSFSPVWYAVHCCSTTRPKPPGAVLCSHSDGYVVRAWGMLNACGGIIPERIHLLRVTHAVRICVLLDGRRAKNSRKWELWPLFVPILLTMGTFDGSWKHSRKGDGKCLLHRYLPSKAHPSARVGITGVHRCINDKQMDSKARNGGIEHSIRIHELGEHRRRSPHVGGGHAWKPNNPWPSAFVLLECKSP